MDPDLDAEYGIGNPVKIFIAFFAHYLLIKKDVTRIIYRLLVLFVTFYHTPASNSD